MTRRIAIDGIIFNVEPLGYEILKAYLDAWSQLNPQRKQLWEEQAAEHLLQQLSGGKSVTTVAHVENINNVIPEATFPVTHSRTGSDRRDYYSRFIPGLW